MTKTVIPAKAGIQRINERECILCLIKGIENTGFLPPAGMTTRGRHDGINLLLILHINLLSLKAQETPAENHLTSFLFMVFCTSKYTLTSKEHPAPMIKCGVKDTPWPLVGEGQSLPRTRYGGEAYNFEDLRRELVSRKYSYKTPKGYIYYNKDFIHYNGKNPHEIKDEAIKDYLVFLSETKGTATSTLNQAIKALKFYYGNMLKKKFGAGIRDLCSPDIYNVVKLFKKPEIVVEDSGMVVVATLQEDLRKDVWNVGDMG